MRSRVMNHSWVAIGYGCAILVSVGVMPVHVGAQDFASRINAHRAANQHRIVDELKALLALPNVAPDTQAIERNAVHLVGMLERRGITARILRQPGSMPAVFGELRTPGATRTVMMYAHYDGQPVDERQWTTPPFQPVVRTNSIQAGGVPAEVQPNTDVDEWRIYARSASDDKSPIVAMLSAIDAMRAVGVRPSVNIKFFFEGGEEWGSAGLGSLLQTHRDLLTADLWLLCDGPVHVSRRPQLVFGVRGVTGLEITLFGPDRALHSGHYGNWAPNPAARLAELLASMRDGEGNIKIAGFSDEVRPIDAADRAAIAAMPRLDDSLRAALQIGAPEQNGVLAERIMVPALNIRGLQSGGVGASAPNAVPTHARASIDFRLVPDQTPAHVREAVEAHIRAQGYTIVHQVPTAEQRRNAPRIAQLQWDSGPYGGYRLSSAHPAGQAVARITERALGSPVIVPILGGSLPISVIADVLGTPMIVLPMVNHDNNQHAFDENVRLRNLWDGILLYATVLKDLGAEWRTPVGTEEFTIDDYMRLRSVHEVMITPDGGHVAYTTSDPDRAADAHVRSLWVVDARGGTPTRIAAQSNPFEIRWSFDGTRLSYRSAGRVWLTNPDGAASRAITPDTLRVETYAWSRDGRIAFIASPAETASATRPGQIYVASSTGDAVSRLTDGEWVADALSWAPDGSAVAFSHSKTPSTLDLILGNDISVVSTADRSVKTIVQRDGMDFGPEWSPDGRHIAFITHDGKTSWIGDTHVAIVPATGGTPRVLTASAGERVLPGEYTLMWEPSGKALRYTLPVREGTALARIDLNGRTSLMTPRAAAFSSFSMTNNGAAMAFAMSDAKTPWDVFMSSTSSFKPRRLVNNNPQLDRFALGTMQRIEWKSKDGTAIDGYVLLPTSPKPPQGYPLIVYLHGGPAWNFVPAFAPHGGLTKVLQSEPFPIHVWAARGHAVFMPNPRGSIGRGSEFRLSVVKDLGGIDVDDVLSGIDALIARNMVDSARMSVTGFSYGGTLTAQLIARTNRFRAAAVGAGIIEPIAMHATMDIPPFLESYFPRAGGGLDEAMARAFTSRLDAIRTPVLIVHGEADARVPVGQSRVLHDRLRANGVEVEMLTFAGQGHGLNRPSVQRRVMTSITDRLSVLASGRL